MRIIILIFYDIRWWLMRLNRLKIKKRGKCIFCLPIKGSTPTFSNKSFHAAPGRRSLTYSWESNPHKRVIGTFDWQEQVAFRNHTICLISRLLAHFFYVIRNKKFVLHFEMQKYENVLICNDENEKKCLPLWGLIWELIDYINPFSCFSCSICFRVIVFCSPLS